MEFELSFWHNKIVGITHNLWPLQPKNKINMTKDWSLFQNEAMTIDNKVLNSVNTVVEFHREADEIHCIFAL